jgi:hypothetical protein
MGICIWKTCPSSAERLEHGCPRSTTRLQCGPGRHTDSVRGGPPATTILELGSDFGLSENEVNDLAGYLLAATEGYLDRVASLSDVPASQRRILANVVQGERRDLEKQLGKR